MRKYIYSDESGNFDFSRNKDATTYFILTTVILDSHQIELDLLELRRELAWKGIELGDGRFHATENSQQVRDEVFKVLSRHNFRVDATILEKPKAQPRIRSSDMLFYKYAWFYHMRYLAQTIATKNDALMVIASSWASKSKRGALKEAIDDVMNQVSPTPIIESVVRPSVSDICLQVADYCCWSIQRKWERGDTRSYDLIRSKIASEYDLFRPGTTTYY